MNQDECFRFEFVLCNLAAFVLVLQGRERERETLLLLLFDIPPDEILLICISLRNSLSFSFIFSPFLSYQSHLLTRKISPRHKLDTKPVQNTHKRIVCKTGHSPHGPQAATVFVGNRAGITSAYEKFHYKVSAYSFFYLSLSIWLCLALVTFCERSFSAHCALMKRTNRTRCRKWQKRTEPNRARSNCSRLAQ